MIQVGNIFDSTLPWKVVPVNCVGVMGKGLALEFKKRYPDMFQAYREACILGLLKPGVLWAWEKDKILCFPTKLHWKNPSELQWIEDGLREFTAHYNRLGKRVLLFRS